VQVIANDLQSFDRQYLSEAWALTGASQEVFHSALTNNSLEGKQTAIGCNVRSSLTLRRAMCGQPGGQPGRRGYQRLRHNCRLQLGSMSSESRSVRAILPQQAVGYLCLILLSALAKTNASVGPGEPGFCGLCSSTNPEACIEVCCFSYVLDTLFDRSTLLQVSEQEGCYATNYNLEYWSDCSGIGADFTNYLSNECSWDIYTVPDAATCFDNDRCPYTRKLVP
jgi:hypothetical protein